MTLRNNQARSIGLIAIIAPVTMRLLAISATSTRFSMRRASRALVHRAACVLIAMKGEARTHRTSRTTAHYNVLL
ncbi:MAG: hypothetical protein IJQ75_07515 [Synergistaceae bacterium]|nr:hypothetical protein [Synergistaceae bacterium]